MSVTRTLRDGRLHRSGRSSRRAPAARAGGVPELQQQDYERLAQLRQLLRRFLAFSENEAVARGLTAQQHQAMLAIKGFGHREPMTTGALAERLGVRHHSAVGLVDRLAVKGLVRRHAGTHDRRQVCLRLTPKAERLLGELSASHGEELGQLAPLLRMLLAHFEPKQL